ncbi:polyprenol reductase-like [Asbolus verrucosus]|uniref:Polyprenal reductase n=1 Tax=Asbolus verrucosus TaxID=1661398 RepID=A0A482W7V7_ASBVE|nr:polyprenol reductase-like [Asbolus verrucosus]
MDLTYDINLCKCLFASITFFMVFFGALINLCEPYLPVLFTRTFRYGKFACKEESLLVKKAEVPKSYFRHFYLTAALLYYPVAFYQVLSAYVFDGEVSNWFKILLDFSCGSDRIATINNHSKLQLQDIGITEVFAITLFMWAWYHQHVATVILANLRKNRKGNIVNQNYDIPQGDWFDYFSSPHLIAEVIMYTGLTLLLSDNTTWWYVYAWVVSGQVESILLSHWWYQSYFQNFPSKRKALVPFLF